MNNWQKALLLWGIAHFVAALVFVVGMFFAPTAKAVEICFGLVIYCSISAALAIHESVIDDG